jgi:protein-tyrosine phosphatase
MSGIYWIDGPWPGKLGIAARPRGGDWLGDDLRRWKSDGAQTIVSLLEDTEESDLDLSCEEQEAEDNGLRVISCPIPDRGIPASEKQILSAVHAADDELSRGCSVVVHCRQGIGRSALFASALLIARGTDPEAALKRISDARGMKVPETQEQRDWIQRFAAKFSGAAASR